jgi:hypothetical protein
LAKNCSKNGQINIIKKLILWGDFSKKRLDNVDAQRSIIISLIPIMQIPIKKFTYKKPTQNGKLMVNPWSKIKHFS